MPLKVILVDDDTISLVGLEKIIKWDSLGYEIAGIFSSSKDAAGYIKSQPFDVMITDICMPSPDGLELVELCSRENPGARILLFSAYRDFEYARKALRYENVVDYLTKPMDYKAVTASLEKIASNFMAKASLFSSIADTDMRMIFFSNLICGNISDREEMKNQLKSTGVQIPPENAACTLVTINIKDFSEFLNKTYKYDSLHLYHSITNIHPFETENGYFSLTLYSYSNITWLIIHKTDDVKSVTDRFVEDMRRDFKYVLNTDIHISLLRHYNSLCELINIDESSAILPDTTTNNEVINSAMSYINEHLRENISLNDVAQHVFMNPVYFSSYFKKKTGKRFSDYLTSTRLTRAAMLLTSDDSLSATAVCDMVGYNNIGYFFKKFKEFYGVTPNEYKTIHKKQ